MKVLLFDMDGVLVEPRAYHRALRETVALVGRHLGFAEVGLDAADIAEFEACGVTSEWDSAGILTALLLDGVFPRHPGVSLPSPGDPVGFGGPPAVPPHGLPVPDFRSFVRALAVAPTGSGPLTALGLAEEVLLGPPPFRERSPGQAAALASVLRHARDVRSPVFRLFQELTLGSRTFAASYGLLPWLDAPGYLLTEDRPGLPPDEGSRLRTFLGSGDRRAAIFTARPSLPPDGSPGSPEAEAGAALAGLVGLPIVGLGGLEWLAARRGLAADALLKPSPVHALAALRLALQPDDPARALEAAGALALDGRADPGWGRLEGAEVLVFEDTTRGLVSAVKAAAVLRSAGVRLALHLLGIATRAEKVRSLLAAGATVYPDTATALGGVLGSSLSESR